MADYCLRCGALFRDGQWCHLVRGGKAAKYRTVGLIIDEGCLQSPHLDVPVCLTVYKKLDRSPALSGSWPMYVGRRPGVRGFAKVSMLDNGLALVGLHRGHVEIWRDREVRRFGGVHGSSAEDSRLSLHQPGLYHRVIDVRFYDLTTPILSACGQTLAENRFVAGGVA
jgi:hypothetical protein